MKPTDKPTINLESIEARHLADEGTYSPTWPQSPYAIVQTDRAWLIAEVKRLEAIEVLARRVVDNTCGHTFPAEQCAPCLKMDALRAELDK